jgi:hypothetical protein
MHYFKQRQYLLSFFRLLGAEAHFRRVTLLHFGKGAIQNLG